VVLGVFLAIEMMVTGGAPGEERREKTDDRTATVFPPGQGAGGREVTG
jgi:hypothetical protein